ncbi:SusC/RagA family TonB-linked outer membrane protein [Flavivirga aquatica]|uniref:SusC/RagA family TonB-linked outer membrane protein n=1 Tax=Flavivirga aquatica TaxID=1849968 RepID=A0A1E5SJK2_9FLAO|nr:SusC/RagA family TonB-linked outer membrane protein [Flavivirga aquatica]OEJ99292.1 SusC/RagA family TonB-linked outer membrane protein [Flavivirga aquatica]
MKTKFSGILTLLLAFVVQISFAQGKTISGTVSDDSGLPLPGATVLIKGSTTGTSSDFDGKYSITANEGATLVFSFVGYTTQEIPVGQSNNINVILLEDAQSLEEVVVVGYGTSTKKSFTGTATTINSENIDAKSTPNISQALTGEVAGITVINSSGQPGNVSTVRIRGYGSINGNRNPLYVIDGVPLTVPRLRNSAVGDDNQEADFNNTISPLNSINPQDIESTTVLKDAAATAIYGSRGANGVILITTKKGKIGESSIEVDVKSGLNTQLIPRYDVITSPEESIGYIWEGIYNRGIGEGEADPVAYANSLLFTTDYIDPAYNLWNVSNASDLIDPTTRTVRPGVTRKYTPESFRDLSFQTSFRTEANLRISGGNEKTKYFASAGVLEDKGYAIKTGYKRYNTRLNVSSKAKKWLKVGSNITYAFSESLNNGQAVGSENLFEFADKNPPIFPVFLRDDDGNLVPDDIFGGNQYDFGSASPHGRERKSANLLNPIGSANYDFLGSKRHDFIGNFSAEILFSSNLTFETKFGLQYSKDRQKSYNNPFYGSEVNSGGSLFQRDNQDVSKNFLQLLRYKKSFDLHSLSFLIAHESNEYSRERNTVQKREAAIPGLLELTNFVVPQGSPSGFLEEAAIESYFSQLNYNFKDTYFLSGSIRRDGSSRFLNEKWGTFGSIGASWIVSNEDFLINNNTISYLKLKTSYGIIGDQDGIDFYQSSDTFNINNLNDQVSLSQRLNGNPDLTWETSKMFQIGVETSLTKFIDLDIDYYIKNTENLFFNRRVGSSQGISSITVNDGVLQNRGLEFNLTAHLIKTENAYLDFTINGERIKNEITKMPIEPSTNKPRIIDTSALYYGYSEGSSIFDFFLREWAGVDSNTGVSTWNQYFDDANSNGTLDTGEELNVNLTQYLNDNPNANIEKQTTTNFSDATLKYVGKSSIPKLRGAFRLSGQYKNFSLSTQFTYSLGGWAFDAQYAELMNDRFGAGANNFHKDISQRWQQPGDITDVPRISDNFDTNVGSASTRWLIKSDYLALNNIRFGYSLPSKFLKNTGINSVNLSLTGDNLFVTSARKGFNPITSETGNTGRRLYAPLSNLSLGARVKF